MIRFTDAIPRLINDHADPDSHTELDATTFHPSQLASQCEYLIYIGKLGLTRDCGSGPTHVGSLVHSHLEQSLPALLNKHPELHDQLVPPDVKTEQSLTAEVGEITLTGHCDLYNPAEEAIIDYKTADTYETIAFDEKWLRQLTLYMGMHPEATCGKIVAVSRARLNVKTFPQEDSGLDFTHYPFSQDKFDELVALGERVADLIRDNPVPTTPSELPVTECDDPDCYCHTTPVSLPDSRSSITIVD